MKLTQTLLTAAAISCFAYSASAQSISFEFATSSNAINGNTTLADSHDTAIDGSTTSTPFDLSSIVSGLVLTTTPAQSDISYTTSGLGIGTGGNMDTSGDAITFSFNRAITFDFIDLGVFSGTGIAGDDEILISFSNSNSSITIVEADFDNASSNTKSFTSGTSLAANESFSIAFVDGNGFTLEGFNITVVPEPNAFALITSMFVLGFVMVRRRSV